MRWKIHYEKKLRQARLWPMKKKDELHHAGVDLDENYRPKTEKEIFKQ